MSSVAVVSVGGAPGVTTLMCAAALGAADRALLAVETSGSGGSLAARWGWDVRERPSVAQVAMDVEGKLELWEAARPWLGSSRLLPAHPSPVVMRQAQADRWLADRLATVSVPVWVDSGRVDGTTGQRDLLTAVGQVWLLVDPTVDQVVTARAAAGWLRKAGRVGLLVREQRSGPGRHRADEVACTLELPLVATIPHDPRTANRLAGLGQRRLGLARSPLVRTATALVDQVRQEAPA